MHTRHGCNIQVLHACKIKLLLSISSLYFSAKTKCKLTVKVERIQLVEAGSDVAEVADYTFDD